jgi:hypothetical protein
VDVESGLTLEPRRPKTEQETLHPVGYRPPSLPKTLIMNFYRDERQEGPVYTYAYILALSAFNRRIINTFDTILASLRNGVR